MRLTSERSRPVEILVIIVAFWLLLVGAYGGLNLLSARSKEQHHPGAQPAARRADGTPGPAPLGGLFSEVDMLRAQVEHLRTEVVALSETATRHEKPRSRRYQSGVVYTELPRMLRRHVKEVRNERHPLGV
jgi:hypothetical protein